MVCFFHSHDYLATLVSENSPKDYLNCQIKLADLGKYTANIWQEDILAHIFTHTTEQNMSKICLLNFMLKYLCIYKCFDDLFIFKQVAAYFMFYVSSLSFIYLIHSWSTWPDCLIFTLCVQWRSFCPKPLRTKIVKCLTNLCVRIVFEELWLVSPHMVLMVVWA